MALVYGSHGGRRKENPGLVGMLTGRKTGEVPVGQEEFGQVASQTGAVHSQYTKTVRLTVGWSKVKVRLVHDPNVHVKSLTKRGPRLDGRSTEKKEIVKLLQ